MIEIDSDDDGEAPPVAGGAADGGDGPDPPDGAEGDPPEPPPLRPPAAECTPFPRGPHVMIRSVPVGPEPDYRILPTDPKYYATTSRMLAVDLCEDAGDRQPSACLSLGDLFGVYHEDMKHDPDYLAYASQRKVDLMQAPPPERPGDPPVPVTADTREWLAVPIFEAVTISAPKARTPRIGARVFEWLPASREPGDLRRDELVYETYKEHGVSHPFIHATLRRPRSAGYRAPIVSFPGGSIMFVWNPAIPAGRFGKIERDAETIKPSTLPPPAISLERLKQYYDSWNFHRRRRGDAARDDAVPDARRRRTAGGASSSSSSSSSSSGGASSSGSGSGSSSSSSSSPPAAAAGGGGGGAGRGGGGGSRGRKRARKERKTKAADSSDGGTDDQDDLGAADLVRLPPDPCTQLVIAPKLLLRIRPGAIPLQTAKRGGHRLAPRTSAKLPPYDEAASGGWLARVSDAQWGKVTRVLSRAVLASRRVKFVSFSQALGKRGTRLSKVIVVNYCDTLDSAARDGVIHVPVAPPRASQRTPSMLPAPRLSALPGFAAACLPSPVMSPPCRGPLVPFHGPPPILDMSSLSRLSASDRLSGGAGAAAGAGRSPLPGAASAAAAVAAGRSPLPGAAAAPDGGEKIATEMREVKVMIASWTDTTGKVLKSEAEWHEKMLASAEAAAEAKGRLAGERQGRAIGDEMVRHAFDSAMGLARDVATGRNADGGEGGGGQPSKGGTKSGDAWLADGRTVRSLLSANAFTAEELDGLDKAAQGQEMATIARVARFLRRGSPEPLLKAFGFDGKLTLAKQMMRDDLQEQLDVIKRAVTTTPPSS